MSDAKKLTKFNECYSCVHRGAVPGSAHISCTNPSDEVKGDLHGRRNGWFMYPHNFDPVWKLDMCPNFEQK